MKKIKNMYILSFIISFMVWIYEPIVMYANNILDLWFDIDIIFGPLILIFILFFLLLCFIYTSIYFISNKINKENKFYKFISILSYILFIDFYIQGNYLIYNLPKLNGDFINWSKYKTDSIISFLVLIILVVLTLFLLKKKKYDKVSNIYNYVSIAIFAILCISLITTCFTTDVLKKKDPIEFTTKNINNVSTNQNFFILLVDAVDSRIFNKVLNESEYKNTFNDFTYYPDTMSTYAFTRDSIPFILSGVWNENDYKFLDYYNNAMDNSPLIDSLIEKNYSINLYDEDILWNSDKTKNIDNAIVKKVPLDKFVFYRQEAKYFIFKYFPYFLKKYSFIETMDFYRCKDRREVDIYNWDNDFIYNLMDNKVNKIDNNNFSYMHIEGGHPPFDRDENFNYIKNGSYDQKLIVTIKIINKFINRLKENGVYDNSVIIVLSDHGYNFDDSEGRQNPILYIKGRDEHHEMYNTDTAISYVDLIDAYKDLLDGKKSMELFKNINKDRNRRFLFYLYMHENHMVEYEQFGKAWELDTLKPTGREFNR